MQSRRKNMAAVLLIGVLISVCGCGKKEDSVALEEVTELEGSADVSEDAETDPEEEDDSETSVYVFVCGQVAEPGVYELPEGSRVFQAIAAAGGMLDGAASDWLNQAEQVTDGQKLYLPSQEEAQAMEASGTADAASGEGTDGRVNLNTASKEELMTLTGIGETKADAIIRYRESNGGFQAPDELMQVEGIKEGTYNKIKDNIVI